MSFRTKTIIGIAIIEASLLLILIWTSLHILRTSTEEELLKRTYTTAKLFASATQNAVLATDLASIESVVRDVIANTGIVYARVRGKYGVLAEGGDPKALSKPFIPNRHLAEVTDDIFDVYADIVVAGEKYGSVEIGFSIIAIKDRLIQARNRTLFIAAIEMVLVALFSFIFGFYLTKGLNALKQASQQIAGGCLGYQIEVHGRDELAQTAHAFNEMSKRLDVLYHERKRAEEEIIKLNENLEHRVKLRTDQLISLTRELKPQSLYDSLTRLPNRILYNDRLQQVILMGKREGHQLAVIALDIDNFKEINDIMGHHTGDLALQWVATRLRSSLRASDTAARTGGDEFAILLPTVNNINDPVATAKKLLKVIEEPLAIGGRNILIKASIGIAVFPEHGEDIEAIMRSADAALYVAKRSKAGFTVYNKELDQEIHDYLAMKTELGNAIFSNEMILHYQPKIDLNNNQIIGVEALVRWEHPKHGLIFPQGFIPLAEQSGFIKQLTAQVIKMALSDSEKWCKAGLCMPVSVNISAVNLQDPEFPRQVADILKDYNIPPSMLELEATETAIMTEPLQAIENIARLSSMGLQISIDDFGTGYSSMAYLRKLLITNIKIDKSFVADMMTNNNDAVIVRSTIALGHDLGLKVVAEGVEDQSALKQLKEFGCDFAQGFFLTYPLPQNELIDWVQQSPLSKK